MQALTRRHRPLYEEQKRLLRFEPPRVEPAVVCRLKDRQGQLEWQANQLSSRILMPRRFVREAAAAAFKGKIPAWSGFRSKFNREEYDPQLSQSAAAVIREGSFGNVSNEAMRIRLATHQGREDFPRDRNAQRRSSARTPGC